ncbi:MAG TPA: aldo/keto reductase [Sedimentisphaerales bacterium]|nr:aldo/keto reductase [Sedimentisphaerales bacterium]
MKIRKLGNTDLNLTTVGLGTWAMGGPWQFGWGPQDDSQAIAAIHKALDMDINWIDTAPIYGCGHSEELLGKALKQISAKPIIATKCGLLWNNKREKIECLDAESITKECHDSLKRLGIETIDLYQMHWPIPDIQIEEAFEAMAKLVKQGKVRYIGVSNYTTEQLKRINKVHPVASLQPPYSMLKRTFEDDLAKYCKQNNIGVVVYSPMQRGLLTGKFNYERLKKLAPDDHRLKHPDFQELPFSETMELVENLKPIAEKNSITLAQLAISWTLRSNVVTAAIVGARKPEQIAETAEASDVELSNEDINKIEILLKKRQDKLNYDKR